MKKKASDIYDLPESIKKIIAKKPNDIYDIAIMKNLVSKDIIILNHYLYLNIKLMLLMHGKTIIIQY